MNYWYLRQKVKVELYWMMQVGAARTFLYWAWLALRGKLAIMDGRNVTSKGGFKMYQIEVSKLPVSEEHDY